jgi:hypothetical protein
MSWADNQLAFLRRRYPEWDIWTEPLSTGGEAWRAKPRGAPAATIDALSPEKLIHAIAEHVSAG